MKHILFISHSILDFNLLALVCESLPLKTKITHLNPENPVIIKKRCVDLIIMDHDAKRNGRGSINAFYELAAKFEGPVIHFSDEVPNNDHQESYQKPFDEESIRELILKFLKKKTNP